MGTALVAEEEAALGMKANEVGNWLRRQHVGQRDHREVLRNDELVVRPGPNFDWFMAGMATAQPTPAASEPSQSGDSGRAEGKAD